MPFLSRIVLFPMLRLIVLVLTLALGFGLGVAYDRRQMTRECLAGEGDWTGTICVNSDLLQ